MIWRNIKKHQGRGSLLPLLCVFLLTSPAQSSALSELGIYVDDAAKRFSIPASWIWAVMQAESSANTRALSPKGAIGLMQLMPETWHMLRRQYGLGDNPYHPHDNILAGAAYLREMHDRFGMRGFLAAYNAGPGRVEDHLRSGRALPEETQNYVAKISRSLGLDVLQPSNQRPLTNRFDDVGTLFVRTSTTTDMSVDNDTQQLKNHQRIVDLSALSPRSDGLFVCLSSR